MNIKQHHEPERAQFQWRHCYGDIVMHRFDQIVLAYWDKVAKPALISAGNEVEYWAKSDIDGAPFIHSDMLDQSNVTATAMCLSLQSIWERQLRSYLINCARSISPGATKEKEIQDAYWDKLQRLFSELRGVPMTAFLSFPDLDLLALLGNVCRHGDGKSATKLWKHHPELWPERFSTPLPPHLAPPGSGANPKVTPSATAINISTEMLHKFTISIADFWVMVKYLYHESIKPMSQDFESQLVKDRQKLAIAIAHFNQVVPI